jgi:diphthine-ammonia ligase
MKVAVSWSGGKDSFLAFYDVLSQRHDVSCLVTFVLDGWPSMQHPLPIMDLQSKAMGIPHKIIRLEVGTRSYRELYKEAILDLIENEEIEGIVTGDIHVIDVSHGHWMDTVCQGLDIEVIMPLWGLDPYEILNQQFSLGLKAIFTHVKRPWFDEDWLGRELDSDSLKDLKRLVDNFGIDPNGENGEYHTMVLNGPFFGKKIEVQKFRKVREKRHLYLKIDEAILSIKKRTQELYQTTPC